MTELDFRQEGFYKSQTAIRLGRLFQTTLELQRPPSPRRPFVPPSKIQQLQARVAQLQNYLAAVKPKIKNFRGELAKSSDQNTISQQVSKPPKATALTDETVSFNFQIVSSKTLYERSAKVGKRLAYSVIKEGILLTASGNLRYQGRGVEVLFMKGTQQLAVYGSSAVVLGRCGQLYRVRIHAGDQFDYRHIKVGFRVKVLLQSTNDAFVQGEFAQQIFKINIQTMRVTWLDCSLDFLRSAATFENRVYLLDSLGEVFQSVLLAGQDSLTFNRSEKISYSVKQLASINCDGINVLFLLLSSLEYEVYCEGGERFRGQFEQPVLKIQAGESRALAMFKDGTCAYSILEKQQISWVRKM